VNNTCRLFCTKERRAKGDRPPVILKIEGNYCRMVEAIGYVVDEINKQFIPNDMRARRPDAKALRKKIDQERPGLNDMGSY
jgi:hypothetical protein